MHPYVKLLNKKERIVVGLMSGTSMDGIDSALVRIKNSGANTEIDLINFQTFPYPDQLRNDLLDISQPGQGTVDKICRLNFVVGEYFADAVFNICRLANFDISQVDFIGSHGQTIHHLPDETTYLIKVTGSTLQIGEPAVIANRTACITVANFRYADMAQGGQGAPLVPYFDYLQFKSEKFNRIILNIGGIANFTILKKQCTIDDVLAYDTGPGNMVINALMKKFYNQQCDENGAVALKGRVSEKLLLDLLKHKYFNKPIPKSTGREGFGNSYVDQVISTSKELKLKQEDIIATITELTARSIADSLKHSSLSIEAVDELIISGGGVHNRALMNSLSKYFFNSRILRTDDFNLPGDAKEAICFAVLANETIAGNPANLPSVTGAKRRAKLGSIYFY